MSDLSARDAAQAAGTSRETTDEWLRLALSAAQMGTWAWDILKGEIRWSDNLEEIHGMPPGSFDGTFEGYLQIVHPEDRAFFQQAIQEAVDGKKEFRVEFRIFWPDQSIHWITGQGRAFYDGGGQPVSMVGLGMDITERVQSTEALRQSETRFRMLVEQSPLSIQVLAPDGRTLQVNRAWEQLWSLTLDDLHDYNMLQDRQLEEKGILSYIRRAFAGEAVTIPPILYDPEQTLPHRAHSPNPQRWTQALIYPVKDETGRIREVVLIHEDITERVQHLEEIKKLNAQLQRSMQETHHRVKNNLQIISALVEIQTGENPVSVPVAAMHRIGQHARALAAIHDLLTQQAKTDSPADILSTKAALEKLIPLLQVTTGGREIHCQVDDMSLPVRESAALALLVSEIISNAVKHGSGDITLSLTAEKDSARLQIGDDGPGFPPDFDWQTAANTGLGLIDSAARYDLRGTVLYENRSQGGANVVVVFPLSELNLRP